MIRKLILMSTLGLTLGLGSTSASADSTDWVSEEAFYDAIARFSEKWMEPSDLAVRVKDGKPEFKSTWTEDSGPFSWSIYPVSSRAQADLIIKEHAEAENLLGGMDRLCLHKFARAVDGDNEYYLLYMVDEEQSGLRCISLPQN